MKQRLRRAGRRLQDGLESVGLALFAVRPRWQSGSNFDEQRKVASWLDLLDIDCGYAVDIGASDGLTMSNSIALYREGFGGLAVERNEDKFYRLAFTLRHYPAVALARVSVSPDNVQPLLASNGAPSAPSFLNLDIDSYDYYVLDRLLEAFRPSLMCVEINEKIPPPVKFTVNYRADHIWTEDHFYGQSISQLRVAAERHAYHLVELEYNNAFLIPAEHSRWDDLSAEEAYRVGYLEKSDRLIRMPENQNMEILQGLPPEECVAMIHHVFAAYAGRYQCSL
jgi:hypothetical protein